MRQLASSLFALPGFLLFSIAGLPVYYKRNTPRTNSDTSASHLGRRKELALNSNGLNNNWGWNAKNSASLCAPTAELIMGTTKWWLLAKPRGLAIVAPSSR